MATANAKQTTTTYRSVKLYLSEGQKEKLKKAIESNFGVTLRLKHENLHGNDEMV